jgi:hypothetical protein
MKKIFIEVALVALFSLLYLLLPGFRAAIVTAACIMAIWVIPVQLILSVNYQNWVDELSGRYSNLDYDARLEQIRNTFHNLKSAETKKLRWFYILTHLFHYLLFIAISLIIVLISFIVIYLGIKKSDPIPEAEYLIAAILLTLIGYYIVTSMFSLKERKTRDEIFNILINKDWLKRLYTTNSQESDYLHLSTRIPSFYNFWLEGKTVEEKEARFKTFINVMNNASKHGTLFIFNEQGKIEVIPVVYASALSKSVAGFLKYCIEDRKLLSVAVLHYNHRELLRDIFVLDKIKNLVFLEDQRLKNTPDEYINIYRATLKD